MITTDNIALVVVRIEAAAGGNKMGKHDKEHMVEELSFVGLVGWNTYCLRRALIYWRAKKGNYVFYGASGRFSSTLQDIFLFIDFVRFLFSH